MLFGMSMLNLPMCESSLPPKLKTEAQRENFILFEELFNRFSNIGVSRIDWQGLPSSVDERFLNQSLYLTGTAAFFNDEMLGYLALPCTMSGGFNVYNDPLTVNAYSFNYNKMLEQGEFVYIRANPSRVPLAFSVFEYTRRMADVLRSIDVLCKKMKHPFMLVCDEKERLTYENLIKKITDNEVMVLGAKNFNLNTKQLQFEDTRVTADLTTLWDTFHQLESILYTSLGIESLPIVKKERLIVDEVNSNNMVTEMNTQVMIKELDTACKRINDMFGLNVSVSANTIASYRREGMYYGEVYNGTEKFS